MLKKEDINYYIYFLSLFLIYFFENIPYMFNLFNNSQTPNKLLQSIIVIFALIGIVRIMKSKCIKLNIPLIYVQIIFLLISVMANVISKNYTFSLPYNIFILIFFIFNYEIYNSIEIDKFMKFLLIYFVICFVGGLISYFNIYNFDILKPTRFYNNMNDYLMGTNIYMKSRFGGFFGSPNAFSILAGILILYFFREKNIFVKLMLVFTLVMANSLNTTLSIVISLIFGKLLTITIKNYSFNITKLLIYFFVAIVFITPMLIGIINPYLVTQFGNDLITQKVFNLRNYLWDIYVNGLLRSPINFSFGVGNHKELIFYKSILDSNTNRYKYYIELLKKSGVNFSGQTQNSIITILVDNGFVFLIVYYVFTTKIFESLARKIKDGIIESKIMYIFLFLIFIQTGEGYTIFYQSCFLTIIFMYIVNHIYFVDDKTVFKACITDRKFKIKKLTNV